MNEELKKQLVKNILATKLQNEVDGDYTTLNRGEYIGVVKKVYLSKNKNDKEFLGIKVVITEGNNKDDFIIDTIYLNDEAFERGIQRIRNILGAFELRDLSNDDVDKDLYLERLAEINGKQCLVTVDYNNDMPTYEYKKI